MKNLALKDRLVAIVAFLALVMIAIGLIGYKGMVDGEAALRGVYNDEIVVMLEIKAVSDAYAVTVVDTCHKMSDGAVPFAEGRKAILSAKDHADKAWKQLMAGNLTGEEKRLADDASVLARGVDAAILRLKDIMDKEDKDRLHAFNTNEL